MCLNLALNIKVIVSTIKKASNLSFWSRLKIYFLMVSKLAFVLKIIRLIIFSAVKKVKFPYSKKRKFCKIKKLFHNYETFAQSRNFSTVMELFDSHVTFFSIVIELFQSHGIFLQSWNFFTFIVIFHSYGTFPQSKKFSKIK